MDQNISDTPIDNTDELTKLRQRCDELENNWKRAVADYRNFEKRTNEEKSQIFTLANMLLIQDMLPVLDNLEMLELHIDDEGLKMIVKEFKQKLTDTGLKEIDTLNKDFDASTMEAVDTTEGEKNKVIEVLNKGYFLNGKLVRPSRVKVGKGE